MFGEAEQTTAGVGGQREASGTKGVLLVFGNSLYLWDSVKC